MPHVSTDKVTQEPHEGAVEVSHEKAKSLVGSMVEGLGFVVSGGEITLRGGGRRKIYNTETRRSKEVPVEDPLPEGFTDEAPGPYDEWVGGAWEPSEERAAPHKRGTRDSLLWDADWRLSRAVDQGDTAMGSAIRTYRQELRDVTDLPGFPLDFEWPTPPWEK